MIVRKLEGTPSRNSKPGRSVGPSHNVTSRFTSATAASKAGNRPMTASAISGHPVTPAAYARKASGMASTNAPMMAMIAR